MNPEACVEVANKSRKQAELYLGKGNVGRAFAHYLVALKLCPSWKRELSQQFTSALSSWGDALDQQLRYKDLFSCYEQALEVFPDNEEVLNNLGSHLYRWGHVIEACNFFRRAVECNPSFLPARRNLQGSCNYLVERWHYRMLNDSVRNDAYRAAITRRVLQQGEGTSVLDIGSGTGLLSLFAAETGAEKVFACDYSHTMIQIASQVLSANRVGEKITLINKLSNNIEIPTDMPARVSLVVTETVDAGLFGEGILQSLLHAWDQLLLPQNKNGVSRIIPEAAKIWIAPVECLYIARKYRLLQKQMERMVEEPEANDVRFNFQKLQLTAHCNEPYDSEDLTMIPGGYRFLATPLPACHIKFNNREDMCSWLSGQKSECWLACNTSGRIDALVAWFDLHLDDITTITSSPDVDRDNVHRANCWDQAVFPLQTPLFPVTGDKLKVSLSCQGVKNSSRVSSQDPISILEHTLQSSRLDSGDSSMETLENAAGCAVLDNQRDESSTVTNASVKNSSEKLRTSNQLDKVLCVEIQEYESGDCREGISKECKTDCGISQEAVMFLNDELWMKALEEVAEHLGQKPGVGVISSVLDLSPFPVLGLHLLKNHGASITCVVRTSGDEVAIKRLVELNGLDQARVQCIEEKLIPDFLEKTETRYDVILIHLVDRSGELKETAFTHLPLLRSLLTENGVLLPQHISIWGQLLDSPWLNHVSRVQDNAYTCGFDIARFINKYQVSQYLDLNLSTLPATRLSSQSQLLLLNMDNDAHFASHSVSIPVTHAGNMNALAYWYEINLYECPGAVKTFHESSHVSQAAILIDPPVSMRIGQTAKVIVRFQEGLFHAEYLPDGTSD